MMFRPSAPARIDLTAPAIERYRRGNTGVDFVSRFDSGRPGPHLMISALVHGNEICGAIALDYLHRLPARPVRGSLTLAFVNVDAYRLFEPRAPFASRFVDEDLNRVWAPQALDDGLDSRERRRARALRPLLDEVDALLDIHSMQYDSPPLALCGPTRRGRALACRVGYPALVVSDRGHAAGRRMRDYGRFLDDEGRDGGPAALLAECGEHWRAATAAAAREAALRFLAAHRVLDAALLGRELAAFAPPPPPRLVEIVEAVTVRSEAFRFAGDYRGMEVIPRAGSVIARDGERAVRTPCDDCVLVMPSARLTPGQTAVRLGRFVEAAEVSR